jgi:metallopeptidase MepB
MWSDYSIEAAMREDIFTLVDAVLKKGEELVPEFKQLLEKEYKAYVCNGLSVPAGKKRDRFKEIKNRLTDLKIQFEKALNEEAGGMWLTLDE